MDKKIKKKDDKPKKNSFSSFLKKRAPIYLGLTGLFILFVAPELIESNLESLFPEDLTDKQKQVVNIVMNYNGPDKDGLTVLEALDMKIKEEYSNDKIYQDKSSKVLIDITTIDEKNYNLVFTFESDSKELQYIWNIDIKSNEIKNENSNAVNIIDLVNFYD